MKQQYKKYIYVLFFSLFFTYSAFVDASEGALSNTENLGRLETIPCRYYGLIVEGDTGAGLGIMTLLSARLYTGLPFLQGKYVLCPGISLEILHEIDKYLYNCTCVTNLHVEACAYSGETISQICKKGFFRTLGNGHPKKGWFLALGGKLGIVFDKDFAESYGRLLGAIQLRVGYSRFSFCYNYYPIPFRLTVGIALDLF